MFRTLALSVAIVVSMTATPVLGQPPAALLWNDPGDIASRNLFYGPGSAQLAPVAPFAFLKEDTGGTQPKFRVRDAKGTEWGVKLGIEAQSETASTRLVWAAGYYAEEAYFFPEVKIDNMTALTRPTTEVKPGGVVTNARFEPVRADVKKLGEWEWEKNPFVGTRELDGLKVLMMMLNNWDAHDTNNRKVRVGSQERFLVSDLGATLGKTGGKWEHTKNDLKDFAESKFIDGVDQGVVKFAYRVRPTGLGMFAILYPPYAGRVKDITANTKGIKIEDARWLGEVMNRLSDAQIGDAFKAAGYDDATIAGYVATLRSRIQQLVALPAPTAQ
ncbi:MAG TPA: hypothetical protein VNJ02_03450 [Vicinamibacterales bacterium]|nr:hypothetical protein [Vicinamibacterales bacterium]